MLHIERLYYHNSKLYANLNYKNNSEFKWRFSRPRGNTFRPLKVDFNFMVDKKFFEGVYPQDIFENKDDEFIILHQGEEFNIILNLESWLETLRLEVKKMKLTKNPKVLVCVAFIFNTPKFGELYTEYETCEFKLDL